MSNDRKYVVLVADDEPSTVALLGRHLRGRGYTVLEASDGDEAWELAHEHLPHLVILDVMMPGMSGWEVCRKIREAVSLAHTGVIMLTGIGEALNEMTSPLYGADAHVDKPFEFADLDRKITQTLERRQAGALGRADSAATDEIRLEVRPPRPTGAGAPIKLPLPRPVAGKGKKGPPTATSPAKARPLAKPAVAPKPKSVAKAKPRLKPVPVKAKAPVKAKPAKKVVNVKAPATKQAKAPKRAPAKQKARKVPPVKQKAVAAKPAKPGAKSAASAAARVVKPSKTSKPAPRAKGKPKGKPARR